MISSTIITLSIKNLNFGDVLFQLLGGFFVVMMTWMHLGR